MKVSSDFVIKVGREDGDARLDADTVNSFCDIDIRLKIKNYKTVLKKMA